MSSRPRPSAYSSASPVASSSETRQPAPASSFGERGPGRGKRSAGGSGGRRGAAGSGGRRGAGGSGGSGAAGGGRSGDGPNYTVRRLVVLGIALALLALIVWAGVGLTRVLFASSTPPLVTDQPASTAPGAQNGPDSSQSGPASQTPPGASDGTGAAQDGQNAPQSAPQIVAGHPVPPGGEATKDGIVDAQGIITVPACAEHDVSIAADSQRIGVGEGLTLPLTVENTGGVACALNTQSLRMVITSGSERYYDSAQCGGEDSAPLLLLSPGQQWSGSRAWDGRIYQGCTPVDSTNDGNTDVADAGTYQAKITVGDAQTGTMVNLIVE